MAAPVPVAPRMGEGGARTVSSTQTLSPGGVPQLGRSRFSSPLTALVAVAHEGRHPMNMLPPPMVAEVILDGKGLSRGRCPVSRFPWMKKCVKLFRFSTHNGIGPVRLLPWSCSCARLESCPSSDGIGPVSLLFCSHSVWRLVRFPSSGGIGPVSLLAAIDSVWRLVKFPSSGGRLPFSS